ncbi:MAG: DUF202 domain-containing protein [Thermodesulfobacteriota bacterium]|nr:MAG: DUF202 domain-containing protein [Thermodesulfobacteriota bacterium]
MTGRTVETAAGPSAGTKLAVARTNLAWERTLMAWIRTSMSLITFGFTIYKIFQFEEREGLRQYIGPREFAMIMIAIALVSLTAATVQNLKNRAALGKITELPRSVAVWASALTSLLGIGAMIAVVFRL